MCQCKSVGFGTYLNTIGMVPPTHSKMSRYQTNKHSDANKRIITIDSCIASEIAWLWHNDIITLNSCCGHNQTIATVIVHHDYIRRMQELGYVSQTMMANDELRVEHMSVRPDETFVLKNI